MSQESSNVALVSVTIPIERYDELVAAEEFLQALEAAGVDNWDGYDYAKEMMGDD